MISEVKVEGKKLTFFLGVDLLDTDIDDNLEVVATEKLSNSASNASITSKTSPKKIFKNFPIIFKNFIYKLDNNNRLIALTSKTLNIIKKLLLPLIFILASTLGGNFFKIFQLVDTLQYFNIQLPVNVYTFYAYFEGSPFDYIPNLLNVEEERLECAPNRKFFLDGMSCSFFNNSGNLVEVLMLVAFLKFLLWGITIFTTRKGYQKD